MSMSDGAGGSEPQQSDEANRLLFERCAETVCLVDPDGKVVSLNPAGEKLTGYASAELIGRPAAELIAPELREHAARQFAARVGGDATPAETVLLTREGVRIHALVTSTLISHDGEVEGILALITDLTAQRSAETTSRFNAEIEANLRASETRFRTFFEFAPIGEAIVALDGRFLEVNRALCSITGYSAPELATKKFRDITHPDDREPNLDFFQRTLAGEIESFELEKRYLHRAGHVVWIRLSSTLVRSSSGEPSYFVSQVQDITGRKSADDELRLAGLRYRTLVEQLPLAMYVRPVDMSLPHLYMSPQAETMIGYPSERWESDADLDSKAIHPDDRDRVLRDAEALRETGKPYRGEYRYLTPGGSVVWVQDETYRLLDEKGEPYVQGFLLDITERKDAEAERDRLRETLHEAQKMEAIGRLAGGVAHDFNNMLTAIKGYSELLLAELQPGTRPHHEAEQIRRAADQASSLPEQLLAIGRVQPLEPAMVDLNEIVASATGLLQHLVGKVVRLTTVPAPHPAFARVDSDRIQQTLVNLALNARDAMPEGGSLTIAVSTTVGDSEPGQGRNDDLGPRAQPGTYVVISVTDDGQGMDAAVRERAFEPFFTTKRRGMGSGLGLASVHGTVSQSDGFVSIESEPGQGTTVRLSFPAASESAATADVAGSPQPSVALLVEDEDLVRELVSSILSRQGFDVHEARDGIEALELLDRLDRPVDLLITDIVMPRMGGRELADRVAARLPRVKTVLISGYSDDRPAADEVARPGSVFVSKPFSPDSLRRAVDEVMREDTSPEPDARLELDPDEVTCVVADDHPAVLDSVSRYLEGAGIGVVARVSRADEAVQEIVAHQPRTALVDITMEPFSGIEVARRAAAGSPQTSIVMYTGHHNEALLREALEAGARGFVLKQTPLSELLTALTTVAAGGTFVDALLAGALATAATAAPLVALTKRERQILTLLSGGMTNEKAAKELGISAETIQSHVRNAMTKLDADTRTQAVATAIRQALIV